MPRFVVGKTEKEILRLLALRNGQYPSMMMLADDYVKTYGLGFYTRDWLKSFTYRLYRMADKGLITIVEIPGEKAYKVVMTPKGWSYVVRYMRDVLREKWDEQREEQNQD